MVLLSSVLGTVVLVAVVVLVVPCVATVAICHQLLLSVLTYTVMK